MADSTGTARKLKQTVSQLALLHAHGDDAPPVASIGDGAAGKPTRQPKPKPAPSKQESPSHARIGRNRGPPLGDAPPVASIGDGAAPKRTRRKNRRRRPKPLPNPLPMLLSIEQAAQVLGLARSTAYLLIANDTLESVAVGGRRMVPTAALTELVNELRTQPAVAFAPSTSVRKRREQRNGVTP